MTQTSVTKQAKFIFSVSKKMRDHIHRINMQAHASQGRHMSDEISMAQLHTLMIVKGCGECTISQLAKRLDVSAPSASTMVDRLVEKALLLRQRSDEDRRVVVVRVTEPAALHIERVERAVFASFNSIVEKIGPEVTEKWCEVLRSVEKVLVEERA
jgi:DNA-binding MarR family transcriptional regulator